MKVQEVILRAIAKQITWWQAAEIIGISDRQLRRWQRRYEEHGYTGLIDRRRGRISERQVPLTTVEEVLRLYKEQYFDFNVRHFHEKLVADHNIKLSYHVGEVGPARSWLGEERTQARGTSQARGYRKRRPHGPSGPRA